MIRLWITTTVVLLIVFLVSAQSPDQCIAKSMPGFDSEEFYDSPTDVQLSYCEDSNRNSCCTRDYSNTVGNFTDPISRSFSHIISRPVDTCRRKLEEISCIMCSPYQSTWIYIRESSSIMWLCKSYCDDLYDECALARTTDGELVSDTYANSVDFCLALFENMDLDDSSFTVLVDPRNNDCWDSSPPCTEDSYYFIYTSCINNQRSKIYAKRPEITCKGGVQQPVNEIGVPCAVSCDSGQRMGSNGCIDCEPGTFSLGGGLIMNQWQDWNELPLPFSTFCTKTDRNGVERMITDAPCGWELNGYQVSSPSNLNDSMSAYLETFITLVEPGEMSFSLKVSSERYYDGFKLYIDRVLNISLVSGEQDFVTVTRNLSAGYHYIQFIYYKDISVSSGTDQSIINSLEFTHVNYASDVCTPCPPGTFSSQTRSSQCIPCPAFTYSNSYGTSQCSPCDPDKYSYQGSTECFPKPECDEDSYYWLYGPCEITENNLEPKRLKQPVWQQPHICSSDELPNPVYVDCAPCEPGQERVGVVCQYCQPGYYSTGNGTACTPCVEGNEAIKTLVFDEFNSLPSQFTTSCQYDCNTDGWVIRSDYIDSGEGHGPYAVVTLSLTETFEKPGTIYFEYGVICHGICDFSFTSTINEGFQIGGSMTPFVFSRIFSVPAGEQTFTWTFTKSDSYGLGVNDRAEIYKIKLTHTSVGGAIACTPCEAGTYNPYPSQTYCLRADPGYYSHGGTEQILCEDGTFSDEPGSTECLRCGENSHSSPDRTSCIVSCGLVGDQVYDLSALKRSDSEMYGPIYDSRDQIYYLNMCIKQHNNHTCFDRSGEPVETFACQITVEQIGQDLGSIFGVIPLRPQIYSQGYKGVTVHLDHGSQCHNGSHYFDRQTYIDVICSPDSGIGTPLAFRGDVVETEKCVYQFTWFSLYGCPICSEEDYYFYITECNQDTGYKEKVYAWKDNPKFCHDGTPLPATEQIPCNTNEDNIYCGVGYYLENSECLPAPIGSYSIGNGFHIRNWETLPYGFSTIKWTGNQYYIESGADNSELVFVGNFVTNGSIEFKVDVSTYGDSTAGLTIYLDDIEQKPSIKSTDNQYTTRKIEIPDGYHFVRLLFQGGSTSSYDERGRSARISEMKVVGTIWAAEYPIPCPPGTFSNVEGASDCSPCGWNTFSTAGQRSCSPCSDNQYSVPGSSSCHILEDCILEQDYHEVYSPCANGTQTVSWEPNDPLLCYPIATQSREIQCVACEIGSYRALGSDRCDTCQPGTYWDVEANECKIVQAGHAAVISKGYWNVPMSGSTFPPGFSTGCNGNCICSVGDSNCQGNLGWRFFADHADSGYNLDHEVDSYLDLHVTLLNAGSISFDYQVIGPARNGLELFINGRQVDLPYHPQLSNHRDQDSITFSHELVEGNNTIRWNYHQEPNTQGTVLLSDLIITGDGGATEDTLCPPGQFSSTTGESYCEDCPPGTANSEFGRDGCIVCEGEFYSENARATECSQCGAGTSVNQNGTDCETNCQYVFGGKNYNFMPLNEFRGPFEMHSSSQKLWLNLCRKASSSVVCIDSYGDPIKTYMCQVDSRGNGIDTGHLLAVKQIKSNQNESDSHFTFVYSQGSTEGCPSARRTTISLYCAVDQENTSPYELETSTPCDLQFAWKTAYGCPVCEESDYTLRESECQDGEQQTASVRISSCYGPAIINKQTQSCPTRYSVSIAFFIAVGIVILILSCAVLVIVIYSRRLHNQYTALVRQSEGNYEMEEMGDTSVTENSTAPESKRESEKAKSDL